MDGPVVAQRLAAAEDLLDHDIRFAFAQFVEPLPQPLAVFARLGEAVHVVDPHAVDDAFGIEAKRQRVHRVEHLGPFDAHACECADVEETPPVYFVRRRAPPREPEVLPFQQTMQPIPCGRLGGRIVCQRRVDRRRAVLRDELPQQLARFGGAGLVCGLRGQALEALGECTQIGAFGALQN